MEDPKKLATTYACFWAMRALKMLENLAEFEGILKYGRLALEATERQASQQKDLGELENAKKAFLGELRIFQDDAGYLPRRPHNLQDICQAVKTAMTLDDPEHIWTMAGNAAYAAAGALCKDDPQKQYGIEAGQLGYLIHLLNFGNDKFYRAQA